MSDASSSPLNPHNSVADEPRNESPRRGEDWQGVLALVRSYEAIVVVANSNATDLEAASDRLPPRTLFVFFNEATRVLSQQFNKPSVLVARSGKDGPAIVRKNKMPGILTCFMPGALKAVIDLRSGDRENFVEPERFGHDVVRFLDLTEYFLDRYTAAKTPSSGYAMIAWLADRTPEQKLFGFGFTGRRSEKWRVFDVHDWVLERIALRILETSGAIELLPTATQTPSAMAALRRQFPDVGSAQLTETAVEVLAQRLERTDMFVDRLWSVTKVGRGIREGLKIFRKRKGIDL